MKSLYHLLILFILPSSLCAQTQDSIFKIYDVANHSTISLDEMVKRMDKTDVIVFGEEHNDSIGHMVETKIFEKGNVAYPGFSLSMEMFATDVQPVIDEYLSSIISEKNFLKEARAWNNYSDYRPLIELAKKFHTKVIAANAATRYSNAVSFGSLDVLQQLNTSSQLFLPPLPIDTATGKYHDKFIKTLGGHDMGGMKIYQTQNLWDATMAWSIAKHAKKNPKTKIFQVNGRFHSDERLGVVAQLQKYAPKLKVLVISSFAAADFTEPNWPAYESLGDFIVVSKPSKTK